jgi:hypothetical protein
MFYKERSEQGTLTYPMTMLSRSRLMTTLQGIKHQTRHKLYARTRQVLTFEETERLKSKNKSLKLPPRIALDT